MDQSSNDPVSLLQIKLVETSEFIPITDLSEKRFSTKIIYESEQITDFKVKL